MADQSGRGSVIGARIAPSGTHDVLSPLHNDERTPLWHLERSVAVMACLG